MFRVVPTTEEMLAGMVDVPEVSRLAWSPPADLVFNIRARKRGIFNSPDA